MHVVCKGVTGGWPESERSNGGRFETLWQTALASVLKVSALQQATGREGP